jgi:hypothetical protein
MSADGSVTLNWADGEHTFRLAIGQMRELAEAVNRPRLEMNWPVIGPMTLWRLTLSSDAWPNDVREILRLGLIGGGAKPFEALALVKRYVEDRPLLENMLAAATVMQAALAGVPDDPVGKPVAETATPTASSSPQSTDSAVH